MRAALVSYGVLIVSTGKIASADAPTYHSGLGKATATASNGLWRAYVAR